MWLNFYIVLFTKELSFILKANVFFLLFFFFQKERVGILKIRYLMSKFKILFWKKSPVHLETILPPPPKVYLLLTLILMYSIGLWL